MDLFEPRNTIGTSTATICHWGSWCFMIGEIEWAYGNNVEHRQHHWGTTLVKSPNGDCRSRHMPCEAVTLWVFGGTKNAKSRGFTPSPPCFFFELKKGSFLASKCGKNRSLHCDTKSWWISWRRPGHGSTWPRWYKVRPSMFVGWVSPHEYYSYTSMDHGIKMD